MNLDNEKLRQAYLDGELSASEISAFEKQLTAQEREQLGAEMRLERALAERLSQNADCPDLVWRRVQTSLARRRGFAHRYRRAAVMLVAAAAVAFVATAYGPALLRVAPDADAVSAAVILEVDSVEELEATSMTEPGREAAAHFLHNHGIDLNVDAPDRLPMAAVHHDILIVGARKDPAGGEDAFTLLLGCCGYPVKIVMAPKGSRAAEAIGRAAGSSTTQIAATRHIGGYITAVVGDHHEAYNLLDIFAGQRGM